MNNTTTYIINPLTHRVIKVGKATWKSLTPEQRLEGQEMYRQKYLSQDPERKESVSNRELEKCPICTEEVVKHRKNTTKCCNQLLCESCHGSLTANKCPYCRNPKPLDLPFTEKREPETFNVEPNRSIINDASIAFLEIRDNNGGTIRLFVNRNVVGTDSFQNLINVYRH
jgi:hypothetical protein